MVTDACGCDDGACSGDLYPGTCGARSLGSCGGLSGFCLPLMSTRLACGSGCGGVYWNEWISDPPECCDPCSDGGCWVGPQPCQHPGGLLVGACRHVTGAVGRVIHLGLYGYRPELLRRLCGRLRRLRARGVSAAATAATAATAVPAAATAVARPAVRATVSTPPWPRSRSRATTASARLTVSIPAATDSRADGPAARPPHRVVARQLHR